MFELLYRDKTAMVDADDALPGRSENMPVPTNHAVTGRPLLGPYPEHAQKIILALGCFWGAERLFWDLPGVWVTAVGYIGGYTPNPSYEEVCTGKTGHTEGVLVIYQPNEVRLQTLLKCFWENHDPTQGMRQGNDVGTQYRSAIYVNSDEDLETSEASRTVYEAALHQRKFSNITTEIARAPEFYFAEEYHQQYLHKNPNGYCGLRGTGVSCSI